MDYEIYALQDKVAIKLDPPDEKVGVLYKPDTVKGDNHIGTIVSIGIQTTGISLSIGDRVVIPRYAGSPTTINGDELLFMRSTDILAKLLPIPRGVEASHASHY